MKKNKPIPIMPDMCKTCPFRDDAPAQFKNLRAMLTKSALTEGSRICHSTGRSLTKCQGKEHLCRGARNEQLAFFHAIGFIEAPTDTAWNKKQKEIKSQ